MGNQVKFEASSSNNSGQSVSEDKPNIALSKCLSMWNQMKFAIKAVKYCQYFTILLANSGITNTIRVGLVTNFHGTDYGLGNGP